MKKKYIIALNPDCVEGEYLRIPARIAGEEQWLVTKAALTPYTEPDLDQVRIEAYEDGYKTAKVQCNIQAEKDMREVGERHYQRGLADAWEAARKIQDTGGNLNWWIHNTSASDAIEKIRQYEQEKEEQEEKDSVTTEDVMRQYLDTFCKGHECTKCILYTPDFTCGRGYHFLTNRVSDEEVRRAYAAVIAKLKE